jgi:hypothetical protein
LPIIADLLDVMMTRRMKHTVLDALLSQADPSEQTRRNDADRVPLLCMAVNLHRSAGVAL